MRYEQSRPARGFTLIELLIVITIIGILIGFILVAAADGLRRAEEKATLSLITKLEIGLSERMEAILVKRADVYPSHILLAGITPQGGSFIRSPQREQVVAQFDLVRSELPDFFVPSTDPNYPFNFGQPTTFAFPQAGVTDYFVPLGSFNAGATNNQYTLYNYLNTQTISASHPFGQFYPVPTTPLPTTGVYGASWGAMAGIHKNIGYLPAGYDGVDNNGDGLVDNWTEGTQLNGVQVLATTNADGSPVPIGSTLTLASVIQQRIQYHKHNTARSEMLYALLVEGQGPLGSVFARDEFTAREVADTDGDGLPEFIDAWGQPLQFYRWPIFYNPDSNSTTYNVASTTLGTATPLVAVNTANYIQKGYQTYSSAIEPRQLDSLDPGQQLMSPSWLDGKINQTGGASGGIFSLSVVGFEAFFHYLHDPNFGQNNNTGVWDRSLAYPRRDYYSRPLILSSGPDKLLGVANYAGSGMQGSAITTWLPNIFINESPATPSWTDLAKVSPFTNDAGQSDDPTGALSTNATDDISNFSLSSAGGGVR